MKKNKELMKEYFFQHPTTRLRVRQIEREIHVPLPSAVRYVKELEKEEFLQRIAVANIIVYAADRTSVPFLLEKRLANIRKIFGSGVIKFMKEEKGNPTMVVFGSYARGEDVETSDIDLYVEMSAKEKIDLAIFEKKLQREIQLFQYKSIHDVENKKLANNILNGIIVNGFVEVFR